MSWSDSVIFRLASVGSYLDALSAITAEMSLKERSDLIYLDKCLHRLWGLGQNVILNWCPEPGGIALLVIPHYAVAELSQRGFAADSAPSDDPPRPGPSEDFFKTLLSGDRLLPPRQLDKVARLLGIERRSLPLRASLTENEAHRRIIEKMVRRYGITYVPSRAVVLFDIVGFSLLTPFEQMTQLNSLSYSLNSAQSKLLNKRIGIDFARSTSGDGFYIWNRDLDLDANINLYLLMHLTLADNAIARQKASRNTVPKLRACFHAGSSYEFHQSEGLNPSLSHYIVGDVTVELARMIERALPNQILVGDFAVDMPLSDGRGKVRVDSVDFVMRATQSLAQLTGLELSGERIDAIKCYLTGSRLRNGEFSVRRITVNDKHGISRQVYNAKLNIYRRNAAPILLGIEDRLIGTGNMRTGPTEHLVRSVTA
ncbi:MAG TPA: hypothetical protein VFY39_10670 [Gammaproteobacteria bacterium]|nr:hypothetical protein [Gammaproteobacteria bacterium]